MRRSCLTGSSQALATIDHQRGTELPEPMAMLHALIDFQQQKAQWRSHGRSLYRSRSSWMDSIACESKIAGASDAGDANENLVESMFTLSDGLQG